MTAATLYVSTKLLRRAKTTSLSIRAPEEIKSKILSLFTALKIILGVTLSILFLIHIIAFYTFRFQHAITGINDCTVLNITKPNILDCPTGFEGRYNELSLADLITYCLGGFLIAAWGASLIPDLLIDFITTLKLLAQYLLPCLKVQEPTIVSATRFQASPPSSALLIGARHLISGATQGQYGTVEMLV